LFSRQQQPYPQGDDRERVAKARQAAEALFAARPVVDEPSVAEDAASPDQAPRKPRVLSVVPPVQVRPERREPPPRRAKRPSRGIPRSQYSRIRTWVEYGMTASEVAEVYDTAVGEIERILSAA
jgi:hypothetical protein